MMRSSNFAKRVIVRVLRQHVATNNQNRPTRLLAVKEGNANSEIISSATTVSRQERLSVAPLWSSFQAACCGGTATTLVTRREFTTPGASDSATPTTGISSKPSSSTRPRRRKRVEHLPKKFQSEEELMEVSLQHEEEQKGIEQTKKAGGPEEPVITSPGTFTPLKADGTQYKTFDEYLKETATLSPWVPTPDAVARRMLQLLNIVKDVDVHLELGCGDGRLNFMCYDVFQPLKTIGVDNDKQWIDKCKERLQKRHPIPSNIQFQQIDLEHIADDEAEELFKGVTCVTMYFVEDGLVKMKPLLEQHLGGTGCRLVCNGYPMPGWDDPDWIEPCLDSKMYLYVLSPERQQQQQMTSNDEKDMKTS